MERSHLIKKISKIGLLIGDSGINQTAAFNVSGCDLGFPLFDAKQQRLFLLFGDSFSSSGSFAEGWRSQTVAYVSDLSFNNDELKIDGFLTDASGHAIAIIEGRHEDNFEMTKIPTGAVEIEGILYVFHFSMRSWSIKDRTRMMNFGGLIKSIDGGKTWHRVPKIVFANHVKGEQSEAIQRLINQDIHGNERYQIDIKEHEGFYFTSIYPKIGHDGYVYLFGEAGFDYDGIKLARVPLTQIEQDDAYEYLIKYDEDGSPIFEKGHEARLKAQVSQDNYVIKEDSREISIIYNQHLSKWMLFKISKSDQGAHVVFYLSNNIYGPYDERHIVFKKDDPMFENATIYAPLTCEQMTKNNGQIIYFLLSQWLPIYKPILMKIELKEFHHD